MKQVEVVTTHLDGSVSVRILSELVKKTFEPTRPKFERMRAPIFDRQEFRDRMKRGRGKR